MKRIDTKVVNASSRTTGGRKRSKRSRCSKGEEGHGGGKTITELKKEAKDSFKEALEYDSGYRKAKENLGKLGLGVPMTL